MFTSQKFLNPLLDDKLHSYSNSLTDSTRYLVILRATPLCRWPRGRLQARAHSPPCMLTDRLICALFDNLSHSYLDKNRITFISTGVFSGLTTLATLYTLISSLTLKSSFIPDYWATIKSRGYHRARSRASPHWPTCMLWVSVVRWLTSLLATYHTTRRLHFRLTHLPITQPLLTCLYHYFILALLSFILL